jgi:phospholipase C
MRFLRVGPAALRRKQVVYPPLMKIGLEVAAMTLARTTLWGCLLLVVAACSSNATVPGQPPLPMARRVATGATQHPISNLIVVVQESRSFDNLFAGYPGADAPTFGMTKSGKTVPLKSISLAQPPCQFRAEFERYFRIAYDGGKMDGWNLLDPKHPLCPYTHVNRGETQPYWSLAKRFAIADHMFSSTTFGSFVNQIYLISGTTLVAPQTYDLGMPDKQPFGCDAPPGTVTAVLKKGRIERFGGPFPCFTQFNTVAYLLDNAHVSWRYYYGGPATTWNPYETIKYVFGGSDWTHDMSAPATNVLSDIANGKLAPVSWVASPRNDSDAPENSGGPKWVSSIVKALQKSNYWAHSAVVVVWADEGNGQFYDNVAPPQLDPMGLGFRVPLIVVSPFAKRGYVSHAQYEFGSILKFIEENWDLPSLGGAATDQRANSISDIFDFSR